MLDPEQAPAYAETVTPPLADVIAPTPEVPVLPEELVPVAAADAAKDPTSGIALQASSLQAPYPATPEDAKPDPAIAVIVDKIKDTAVTADAPRQNDSPRINVHNAQTPAINNLLDKAQAKLDADDGEGARAIYDRIIARDSTNRAALAGKAKLLESAGQFEAAAAAYRRLLALNPKDETARVSLVSVLGAWGAPAASDELQRIVGMRPGFAPAQAALAEALVGQDNALAALPHAWRASQIEPENILYRLNLAIAYDRLGRSSDAIGFYREVIKAYDAADDRTPALPVSLPEIRQRVNYLETMMESAGKLASAP
jgi:tetratricopeptide (TPR) repeat protein